MDILLYVLQENLEVIGVMDSFISLLWIERLKKAGSFELYVPATVANRRLLYPGRWLARSDTQTFMYISSIQERHNKDGRKIIATGYSAEGVFRKRMYPKYHVWKNKMYPENLMEVINAMTPLGFNLDWTLLSKVPVFDVPNEYITGNMEDYLRYVMSRTKKEDTDVDPADAGPTWYKQYSEAFRIFLSTDSYVNDMQLNAWIEPIEFFTSDSTLPTDISVYSEELGNIYNTEYSCTEEDTYNYADVFVDRNFSVDVVTKYKTYEIDSSGKYVPKNVTENVNVTIDDVDVYADEDHNPILPQLENYSVVDDARVQLGLNETFLYVEPFVNQYTRPVEHDKEYWKQYTKRAIKIGTNYDLTQYEAEGDGVYIDPEEETPHYTINESRTLSRMESEVKTALTTFIENIQGTMKVSYEDHMKGECRLGQIVCYRDNIRGVQLYKQIEEVEETFDENGYSLIPTLGDPIKTIWDLI